MGSGWALDGIGLGLGWDRAAISLGRAAGSVEWAERSDQMTGKQNEKKGRGEACRNRRVVRVVLNGSTLWVDRLRLRVQTDSLRPAPRKA
eukprot:780145-Pleurochrysis_carterae.AAC.1